MAFWHPCHTLQCWALGAHFRWGHQQMHSIFRATHPQVPKSHWTGMPTTQRRQKIAKISVEAKNSQLQGLSGKEVLTPATNCKNQPGTLVGMPWQGFGGPGQCSKSGGLACGGCHVDLCIFLVWAAFHKKILLGRPACHLANVLAPKVGCALKCAA